MDMKEFLDFMARHIAETEPERHESPMDYVLSFTGPGGGSFSGSSEGGFGVRLDGRPAPPHLWAFAKRRAALSLDPYSVEVVEVDGDEPPTDGVASRVIVEHVLHPRVEAYVLEGTIAGERHHAYATIAPIRYERLPLQQMASQLVLTPCSPTPREPFEPWPEAGCGLAMDLCPAARRVWAWHMAGELDAPQEVRLVLVDGEGVPDQGAVDDAPVLASVRIAPSDADRDAPFELAATYEGVSYRLTVELKDSARRARALLRD